MVRLMSSFVILCCGIICYSLVNRYIDLWPYDYVDERLSPQAAQNILLSIPLFFASLAISIGSIIHSAIKRKITKPIILDALILILLSPLPYFLNIVLYSGLLPAITLYADLECMR
jgi:hypothetical protein